jgi:hypothetical protein
MKIGNKKQNKCVLALFGGVFLIMLDNKMGLSILFIEHMNPLKCI